MQNSFKSLLEEDKKHFEANHQNDIKNGIQTNLGMLRFVGEVVEIYLSRVKDVMVIAFSDNETDSNTLSTK